MICRQENPCYTGLLWQFCGRRTLVPRSSFLSGICLLPENARFEVQVLYLRRKISLIVIVAFALGNLAIFALYPVYKAVLLVNAAAPKAG